MTSEARDAKRYDRRMEAKYGDSGRRGGHGERHDKHAGERQGKPFRKHAKILQRRRSAPADVRQRSNRKAVHSSNRRNERHYTGLSQYQPLTAADTGRNTR